jgi:Flp pilus assembly protein TadG
VGAVEFALLCPIIVGLVFATIEIANVWQVQRTLQSTASDAAGRVTTGAVPAAKAEAFISNQLDESINQQVEVLVNEETEEDEDGLEVEVVLRISLSEILLFGSWLMSKTAADHENMHLSASATMLKQ